MCGLDPVRSRESHGLGRNVGMEVAQEKCPSRNCSTQQEQLGD